MRTRTKMMMTIINMVMINNASRIKLLVLGNFQWKYYILHSAECCSFGHSIEISYIYHHTLWVGTSTYHDIN